MSSNDIQWKSKEPAPPWKRIVSFICDIVLILPPILVVAGSHNFNPMPEISLLSWILFSLWGWYTFLFGIGLPLYKGVAGVGDVLMNLGVTDLEGRKVGRLKLAARQIVFCLFLLWALIPSPFYAGIIVNILLFSSIFRRDSKHRVYMHVVDKIFRTTVMTIETGRPKQWKLW